MLKQLYEIGPLFENDNVPTNLKQVVYRLTPTKTFNMESYGKQEWKREVIIAQEIIAYYKI